MGHRILIIALATFLPTALAAQDVSVSVDPKGSVFWSGLGWTVYSYPDENMCEVSAQTKNDEDFTLSFFPKYHGFIFIMTNTNATSLNDGQKVDLSIQFVKSGKIDQGWGQRQFNVAKLNGKVTFTSPLLPIPLDEDFATSEAMGIATTSSTGTFKPVAAINLSGSGSAIVKLRTCALQAAKLNPKDPFVE